VSGTAVAVVGAGLAGLSCAARLAHAGFRVDLYEQQLEVGGKAGSRSLGGFRFDTGPSLFTMPQVFGELFSELGEHSADHLHPVTLDPICTYFYPEGPVLRAYGDPDRFAAEIEAKFGESGASLRRYLRHTGRIYEAAAELFLRHSLHEPSTYLQPFARRALPQLGRLDAFRSLHQANSGFFADPRLVQLFDRYATYNGSSPFRAPATLGIIPYVEHAFGGYGLEGGIRALPRALEDLARRQGAAFHLGRRVQRILVREGRVRGILVDGRERDYRIVVSNADLLQTYEQLLSQPQAPPARRYRRLEPSSSGLVFLWGLAESYPELGVNNIFFSADYRREFRELFEERVCPRNPTIYVNVTSKLTPQDAPRGAENWFVLVNAPYLSGQDWKQETRRVRQRILSVMERVLGRPVGRSIVVEQVMTPEDIQRNTGSTRGSLYGISSNSPLAAFLRHPNRSRRIRGLYFCGGSVHPGGGMPLAVLSGKIAADLVKKHEE
jgi:diapolycopene oxygenase